MPRSDCTHLGHFHRVITFSHCDRPAKGTQISNLEKASRVWIYDCLCKQENTLLPLRIFLKHEGQICSLTR